MGAGYDRLRACCGLLLLLVAPGAVEAAFFEKLLMPGPLAEAHAELEDDCDACHGESERKEMFDTCIDCHDHRNIAEDLAQGSGLHGRLEQLKERGCNLCHDEHAGRKADILNFQTTLFDHRQTDFELDGAHTRVPCRDCHQPDKQYHEAPAECFDCHEKADAHGGKLGEECDQCHNPKAWLDTGFDHDETDFALQGSHTDVACELCHADNRYEDTPADCVACHRIDDLHLGKAKDDCALCHSPEEWKKIRFDHQRKTDFTLRGAHRKQACAACHAGDMREDRLKTECVACHRKDDTHKGRNGKDCKKCHDEREWKKPKFDHARETDFKLTGKHQDLACTACHKGEPKDQKDKNQCFDCHGHNDVHRGVNGRDCADCHQTEDWKESKFDHAKKTLFALQGKHRDLTCTDCHRLSTEVAKLSTECYDCHRRDDVHKGQQGSACDNCHADGGWVQQVRFEHDITRFPLLGQHAVQSCEACHESNAFRDTSLLCNDCHAADDSHERTLGTRCDRCHNPNAWTAWLFDHDTQTEFELTGPHEKLACANCHTAPTNNISQASICHGCHQADDVHAGGFGRDCGACHRGDDFSKVTLPMRSVIMQ